MATPRVVFFDLETRMWASDLRPDDVEAGWDELRSGKGGASAIAVYDSRDSWLYSYDDHTIEACARHLEAADIVVGFNSDKFDIPCVEGLARRRLRIRRSIDIYQLFVTEYARRGIAGQKGDFTLDAVSKRNLGRGKIDHGSNAKKLMKDGHWGKLFNYCGDDVHLTRDLFNKMVADGGLIGLRGQFVSLPIEGLS
jgi:DEAD/DEAH box helicase domain-containing protein